MKPTLKGSGKLTLVNGKLVGVNVGGQALKKVQHLPAIGNLVPQAVVKNHPELFANPDTDIQLASLSFVLADMRITSHDIKVQTQDYNLLGDGWFDMDKNIDLAARIVLSPQFSKELIEQKKEVGFIANKDGQIDIPLQVVGQLPKPQVLPERDGTGADGGNQRDARARAKVSRQSFRQEGDSQRIAEVPRRRFRRKRRLGQRWRQRQWRQLESAVESTRSIEKIVLNQLPRRTSTTLFR